MVDFKMMNFWEAIPLASAVDLTDLYDNSLLPAGIDLVLSKYGIFIYNSYEHGQSLEERLTDYMGIDFALKANNSPMGDGVIWLQHKTVYTAMYTEGTVLAEHRPVPYEDGRGATTDLSEYYDVIMFSKLDRANGKIRSSIFPREMFQFAVGKLKENGGPAYDRDMMGDIYKQFISISDIIKNTNASKIGNLALGSKNPSGLVKMIYTLSYSGSRLGNASKHTETQNAGKPLYRYPMPYWSGLKGEAEKLSVDIRREDAIGFEKTIKGAFSNLHHTWYVAFIHKRNAVYFNDLLAQGFKVWYDCVVNDPSFSPCIENFLGTARGGCMTESLASRLIGPRQGCAPGPQPLVPHQVATFTVVDAIIKRTVGYGLLQLYDQAARNGIDFYNCCTNILLRIQTPVR